MSLLKEFESALIGNFRPDLKKSDGSDAGSSDVEGKMRPNDVSFSQMRNTINADGEVTGSDVADYLERAAELNDEVDTVPFGLETDDGDVVKVYVNCEQADAFEEEMKKMLGIEDDIEEAINKLAQKFDIVDVVWPKDMNDPDNTVSADDLDSDLDFDALDDGDSMDVVAEYDPLSEAVSNPAAKPGAEVWFKDELVGYFERIEHDRVFVKPALKQSRTNYAYSEVLIRPAVTMDEDQGLTEDDPKAPTPEEAAAFRKLNEVVMNLAAQGSSGVSAATGYDSRSMTKSEMIAKYIKERHTEAALIARTWLKRIGESTNEDVVPYWLAESLIETDAFEQQEGDDMSIGSIFLKRVLAEAKDGGYSFDRGTESAKRQLRDIGGKADFADKIAEVANMCGISGMYLNKPEVREGIIDAATTMRSKPARFRSFLALHSAMTAYHGVTPSVDEAVAKADDDLEGSSFQRTLEEVLVSLGIPESMVSGEAKAGIKSGLRKMANKFRSDKAVRSALVTYARYSGIKANDGEVGMKKRGVQMEAAPAGTVPTRGTDADAADDGDDNGRITDVTAAANTIMKMLGVDLTDTSLIRVTNASMLARSMKTAGRKASVKRAMGAFLRITDTK